MTMWQYITNSTLKREFAIFLTVWLLVVATYLFIVGATDMQFRILELFTYPILAGAFAAFGLDFIAKQTNLGGPPADTSVTTTSVDMPATMTVTTTSAPDEVKG